MTDTIVEIRPQEVEEDTVVHGVCCELEPELDEMVPNLCDGRLGPYTGVEEADGEIDCVVCVSILAGSYCPTMGFCPYGDTSNEV